MESLFWCLLGIISGGIAGIIPGSAAFVAVAIFYSILEGLSAFNILLFYIAVLITTNYTNSICAILYGIPGDATAIATARYGHKFFRKGFGHLAVSSNAISSSIGSMFAIGLFIVFYDNIYSIFKFYNSTLQVVIISIAIFLITVSVKQHILKTILLFILGGVLAKIGFDNLTFKSWGTFGNPYLSLGIPFNAVMIGLFIIPEFLKFVDLQISEPRKITKFGMGKNTLGATLLGSFIGFWSGLIPGITNILGSYASAAIVKRYFKMPYLKCIAAAEAANNSGALSSLLPLIILGIPIVGSEVLVFYLVSSTGFVFGLETIDTFKNILYFIPIIIGICLVISWAGFNLLGKVSYLIKEYKNYITCVIIVIISIIATSMYPIKEWMIMCIIGLTLVGYFIRKWDTIPIVYGYFLTDLFWDNLIRTMIIHF
jgi:putative tricarboxylic transport membrane protein